jgi:hypothetical protein
MRFQFSIRDLLLVVVIGALAAGWWADHQRITRLPVQKWEYLTTYGSPSDDTLNSEGNQGWELCGIDPASLPGNTRLYLKRPKE